MHICYFLNFSHRKFLVNSFKDLSLPIQVSVMAITSVKMADYI